LRCVILESPYAGATQADIDENVRYARACLRDSLLHGEAPIASHLLYTQEGVLDDNIPSERALGISAGLAWRQAAEATAVYYDRGISKGMAFGIEDANESVRPVEFRSLYGAAAPLLNGGRGRMNAILTITRQRESVSSARQKLASMGFRKLGMWSESELSLLLTGLDAAADTLSKIEGAEFVSLGSAPADVVEGLAKKR
jgi:hypothetical protein